MDVAGIFLQICRMPLQCVDQPQLFHHQKFWNWRTRIPDYFNLWILLAGSVVVRLRGQEYHLNRPAYLLLPPGEQVDGQLEDSDHMDNLALHLAPKTVSKLIDPTQLPSSWGVPVSEPEWMHLTAIRCVRNANRPDPYSQACAAAAIEQVFATYLRDWLGPKEAPNMDRVQDLADRIRLRPAATNRVDKEARRLGLSRSQLNRLFQNAHGTSVRDFITQCRMQHAAHLLRDSTLNVSQIAEACGYADIFYFSRHFKLWCGQGPTAYRSRPSHTP